MSISRLLRALALLSCLVAPTAFAQGAQSPQAVLDELYGIVGKTCTEGAATGAYIPLDIARTFFTDELKGKLEGALSTGAIDFDIFTDSQDCGVSDIKTELASGDLNEAVGVVHLKNFGEERAIVLKMGRSGTAWLVTDISYAHRAFSLKSEY